ncbi:MAG: PadR family transcriptional regulator [Armatimonadota bacterium]|nr:PadR family transcriptional regulator [Armatimonadota bacterium]
MIDDIRGHSHRGYHHPHEERGREQHHPEQHGGHRRHPGGGMQGGPGGPRRERMERGALRAILLDALQGTGRHGYDIIRAFEERSRGQYVPSPGTVYPTLQYLEDLGFVRSVQENDRRVYELTDAGRAELESQRERVDAFWAPFTASPGTEATEHEIGFLQDELRDLSRTVWGSLRVAVANGDLESIRRVRAAVEQCQNEIRRLITENGAQPAGQPQGG